MKKLLALLMVLLMISVIMTGAFADFGDFSSSSDYGSDTWSSSSSSWDDDDDYDYDSGDSFVGSFAGAVAGNAISSGNPTLIGIVIVVIIIYFVLKNRKKGKKPVAAGGTATAASKLNPMEAFRDRDPAFSETNLTEKISNLYVQLQNAWTAKDLTPLRPYLTNELYAKSERQVNSLKTNHQTNYIDRIAVLGVTLRGWYTDGKNDSLVALVNTRITDYTVDDKTGNVVRGDKNKELFMTYEWTFTRPTGMTTPLEGDLKETNCPNCGAPLNVAQTAKCPYCGTLIENEDHDWVLSDIKGLMQRS